MGICQKTRVNTRHCEHEGRGNTNGQGTLSLKALTHSFCGFVFHFKAAIRVAFFILIFYPVYFLFVQYNPQCS